MAKLNEKEYLKFMIPLMEQGKRPYEIINETGLSKSAVYRLYNKHKDEVNLKGVQEVPEKVIEITVAPKPKKKEDFVQVTKNEVSKTQGFELGVAKQFADFLKYPHGLINNIQNDYDTIGRMNIDMQKLLHDLEESETEEELHEVAKKLYVLRKERRVVKNRYRLGTQLRYIFTNNRTHSNNLLNVSDAFTNIIDSIENYKNYSKGYDEELPTEEDKEQASRYEQTKDIELDEWQKNLAHIMNTSEEKSS